MGARPSTFAFTQPGSLRLYSTYELIMMPLPEWLVESVMPEGAMVALYAPPESLKSFAAIDIAMSVATGTAWQGRPVKQGLVVYISAEGGAGIGKRALAWLVHHNIEPTEVDMAWMIESFPVTAESEDVQRLIQRLEEELQRVPSLIVIDTLARCFDGDENQQEDMNNFVAGIDLIRHAFDCAVMVVHHTRLDGERERGNTAFRGAADTMIALKREGETIEVICAKQKDAEHFNTFELEKLIVAGTDSCVLIQGQGEKRKQARVASVIAVLQSLQPAKWDAWKNATKLSASDFAKVYQVLKKDGRVLRSPKGLWSVQAKGSGQ